MEITAVLGRIGAARGDAASGRSDCESALVEARRLRAWVDASEADLARRLASMVSFPEKSIAETSKGSLGQACTVMERAATLKSTPAMAAALDAGAVTAGHADLILTGGSAPRSGRPEFLIVVDADAPSTAGPVAEFSIPVEVPWRVLLDLVRDADVHTVVVRNGVVLHAPGTLSLGRSTRLANRTQRRTLCGLYATCATRAVACTTTAANCITSSGGGTEALPTSTTAHTSNAPFLESRPSPRDYEWATPATRPPHFDGTRVVGRTGRPGLPRALGPPSGRSSDRKRQRWRVTERPLGDSEC